MELMGEGYSGTWVNRIVDKPNETSNTSYRAAHGQAEKVNYFPLPPKCSSMSTLPWRHAVYGLPADHPCNKVLFPCSEKFKPPTPHINFKDLTSNLTCNETQYPFINDPQAWRASARKPGVMQHACSSVFKEDRSEIPNYLYQQTGNKARCSAVNPSFWNPQKTHKEETKIKLCPANEQVSSSSTSAPAGTGREASLLRRDPDLPRTPAVGRSAQLQEYVYAMSGRGEPRGLSNSNHSVQFTNNPSSLRDTKKVSFNDYTKKVSFNDDTNLLPISQSLQCDAKPTIDLMKPKTPVEIRESKIDEVVQKVNNLATIREDFYKQLEYTDRYLHHIKEELYSLPHNVRPQHKTLIKQLEDTEKAQRALVLEISEANKEIRDNLVLQHQLENDLVRHVVAEDHVYKYGGSGSGRVGDQRNQPFPASRVQYID